MDLQSRGIPRFDLSQALGVVGMWVRKKSGVNGWIGELMCNLFVAQESPFKGL
jgi:hypothetical protein